MVYLKVEFARRVSEKMFAEHKIETTLAVSIKRMVSSNIPVATNPHSTNEINSCHFFVIVPAKYKEETVNMAVRQLMGCPAYAWIKLRTGVVFSVRNICWVISAGCNS